MSVLSFIREAGEKLFDTTPAQIVATQAAADPAKVKAADDAAADAILAHIEAQDLKATGLTVTYEGATGTVTVYGIAPDQETKEKIVLCCGNVHNVAKVDDRHLILIPEFASPGGADRVSREIGRPWMREHIVPILA